MCVAHLREGKTEKLCVCSQREGERKREGVREDRWRGGVMRKVHKQLRDL